MEFLISFLISWFLFAEYSKSDNIKQWLFLLWYFDDCAWVILLTE